MSELKPSVVYGVFSDTGDSFDTDELEKLFYKKEDAENYVKKHNSNSYNIYVAELDIN